MLKRCSLRWSLATAVVTLASAAVLSVVTVLAADPPDATTPNRPVVAAPPTQSPDPTSEPQHAQPEDGPVPTERIVAFIEHLGGDRADKALLAAMHTYFGYGGLHRFAETEMLLREQAFRHRLERFYQEEIGRRPGVRELLILATAERDFRLLDYPNAEQFLDRIPTAFHARGVPSVPIFGRVLDADSGNPIPGAFVYHPGMMLAGVLTAPDGSFELQILTGGYDGVEVDAEGYVRNITRLHDTSQAAQLTIQLQRGVAMEGSVHDEQGAPVSGARVHLVPHVRGAAQQTAWTDDAGRFTFEHAVVGPLSWMHVDHARYQDQTVREIEEGQPIRIQLVAGKEISGVVTIDGQPLAAATVEATSIAMADDPRRGIKKGQVLAGRHVRARTDSQGRYAIRSLAPGEFSVQADAHGFAPVRQFVRVGRDPQSADFQLETGRRVSGIVLGPDGKPPDSAVIGAIHWGEKLPEDDNGMQGSAQYIQRHAVCDAEGRFVLENMPNATITISAVTADPRQVGTVSVPEGVSQVRIRLKDAPLPQPVIIEDLRP